MSSDGHKRVKTIELIDSLKLSSYLIVRKTTKYFKIELNLVEDELLIYLITQK